MTTKTATKTATETLPALSKAERAAAARTALRAAQEAKALRLNLLKRKAQNRAREASPPSQSGAE